MCWYELEQSLGATDEMIEVCKKFPTREEFYKSEGNPMFILWSTQQKEIREFVDKELICMALRRLSRSRSKPIRLHIANDIRTPEAILVRLARSTDHMIQSSAKKSLSIVRCGITG